MKTSKQKRKKITEENRRHYAAGLNGQPRPAGADADNQTFYKLGKNEREIREAKACVL